MVLASEPSSTQFSGQPDSHWSQDVSSALAYAESQHHKRWNSSPNCLSVATRIATFSNNNTRQTSHTGRLCLKDCGQGRRGMPKKRPHWSNSYLRILLPSSWHDYMAMSPETNPNVFNRASPSGHQKAYIFKLISLTSYRNLKSGHINSDSIGQFEQWVLSKWANSSPHVFCSINPIPKILSPVRCGSTGLESYSTVGWDKRIPNLRSAWGI